MSSKSNYFSEAQLSNNSVDNITYWEKTVEWLFIRKHFRPSLLMAPLDGAHEAGGDAVLNFGDSDRWMLIEFKKNKSAISSEKAKYPIFMSDKWEKLQKEKGLDFSGANKAFEDLTSDWKNVGRDLVPHFIVYASPQKAAWARALEAVPEVAQKIAEKRIGTHSLRLHGCTYWGTWAQLTDEPGDHLPKAEPVALDDLWSVGAKFVDFKAYLKTVLLAKCSMMAGGSSNGDVMDWNFATVMALREDGTSAAFALKEFALKHVPECVSQHAAEGTPAAKSVASRNKLRT